MKSIAHIYEKYWEKPRIADLAAIAKMSRSAYISKFLTFTGTAPGEFILRCRMDAAQKMLLSTNDSISDIAAKTGFYDTAHFIHTFVTRNGMTPLEYRKRGQITE